MGDRLMNEGPKWVILVVWLCINIALFIGHFFMYQNNVEFYYLRQLTGTGLSFARGSAACLNFNCMLILVPVCRNFISYLRGSCHCCKRNIRRQLDRNLDFHILCAYAVCFFTAVHYIAHAFNIENLINAWDDGGSTLKTVLTLLPLTDNGTAVNFIRSSNTNPMYEAIKTVPGLTGVLITLILVVMVSTSVEIIRQYYYELFWYTHHLFVIFFLGLVIHGLGGVVRGQSNVDQHDPEVCAEKAEEWDTTPECSTLPQFASAGPQTWKWVLAPLLLYSLERLLRFYHSLQPRRINKVVSHPSGVVELQLEKCGLRTQAGQYVFLHCPQISRLEWHPFTLTSAPDDLHLTVHIRVVGDWTGALARVCHVEGAGEQQASQSPLPTLSLDGPFGTCSEDAYRYQVDIMIGAGIGVTPFASILKDLWYRYRVSHTALKLQRIYFFWICPSTNTFEWFGELLKDMEREMAEAGTVGFLDYNIYLTRGWSVNQAANIASHNEDPYDIMTGLKQKTKYGRPNWDQLFAAIAQAHPGVRIGTFFCGPKPLSEVLNEMCNKYSSSNPKGVHFVYNKENF